MRALRHPFLCMVGAELATLAAVVAVWNIVQRYRDNGMTLRDALRL